MAISAVNEGDRALISSCPRRVPTQDINSQSLLKITLCQYTRGTLHPRRRLGRQGRGGARGQAGQLWIPSMQGCQPRKLVVSEAGRVQPEGRNRYM